MNTDEIEKLFPLDGEFESDARYVWPKRWAAVESALAAEREKVGRLREACQAALEDQELGVLKDALDETALGEGEDKEDGSISRNEYLKENGVMFDDNLWKD